MHVGGKLTDSNYCYKKFSTQEEYAEGTNHINAMFVKKIFSFRNNLKQHILVNHADPANRSKVPCRECKKEVESSVPLRDHFRFNTLVKIILYVKNVTRHLRGLTIYYITCFDHMGWENHSNVKSVNIDANKL